MSQSLEKLAELKNLQISRVKQITEAFSYQLPPMKLPVFNPLFLASWIAPGWAPLEADVCALDGVTWWEQTVTDHVMFPLVFSTSCSFHVRGKYFSN